MEKVGLEVLLFLLIISTASRVCLTSTIINLTCVRTVVYAIFYRLITVPAHPSDKRSPAFTVLLETIIADIELCSTLLLYADSPHRNISIASLALHFGGTMSMLEIMNPFLLKG